MASRDIRRKVAPSGLGGPDLSDLADRRPLERMGLYLRRKAVIDDKKHVQGFKGTDEELQALVRWLGMLKGKAEVAEDE